MSSALMQRFRTQIQTLIPKHQHKSHRFVQTNIKQKSNPNESDPKRNEKLIKVAIIGVPNAGKSTFINTLVNHRTCPTSNKVHTTRSFSKAICNRNNSQLILFDTPGLVTDQEMKKHQLENTFVSSMRHSIQNSNLIGVIHDVSNSWTRNQLHSTVLDTLKAYPTVPSFLILNKVDTLKSKRVLLDLARLLTENTLAPRGFSAKFIARSQKNFEKSEENKPEERKKKEGGGWPHFNDVFMISSLTGDGCEGVMKYILNQCKQSDWEYPENEFTDQPNEELIVQSVRARLLDYLPQEIPYRLKSELEFYTLEKGKIFTSVQVICPSERIERLICGQGNGKLKQITERISSDLVEMFGMPVSLTLSTVSKKRDK